MKKLKIKGLKKEMSTTGTGASFAPGTGGQYATPKAFRKKRNEAWSKLRQGQLGLAKNPSVKKQIKVSEPFLTPSPSIPNRKSKAIDYVQLWGEAKEHYKHHRFDPIKDTPDSQAWAGVNTGIDMDSLDAANVLELAKFANKKNRLKLGDTSVKDGVKYTVSDIDKNTGAIEWKVDYIPNFEKVFNEFKELRSFLNTLAKKTDDEKIDNINDDVRTLFNRYRTHVRNEYPDAYKRVFNEEKEDTDYIKRRKKEDDYYEDPDYYKENISEVRYSRFKKEAKLRTPTEQIHRAVKEIRQRMNEMLKIVGHTERMKSELKQSNEGMSYLKRTRNALSNISEKLTELNNRIKGLTE